MDEPLGGTAPEARGVLLIENDSPWGVKALAEAGLGEVEARCKSLGLKALLVRRADRSPARGRVFAAWFGPNPFVAEVADVDAAIEPLARGELPDDAERCERMWLVCTNGKRDACCARDGLPVARALAALRPDEAWECSHLGGHRFAANVALLPDGLCFGRIAAAGVTALVAAVEAGTPPLELVRGRMALSPAAQVAELAALATTGLQGPLDVHLDGSIATVGSLRIELQEEHLGARPFSCDAEPEPLTIWRASSVTPA